MSIIACPVDGCTFETANASDAASVALIQIQAAAVHPLLTYALPAHVYHIRSGMVRPCFD